MSEKKSKENFLYSLMKNINNSPTAFHAVNENKKILLKNNFIELNESESWKIEPGNKYFFTRNNSSIIAFIVPKTTPDSFMIVASHNDYPCFKIINNSDTECESYKLVVTEPYPKTLNYTWLDKPLSVAGRLIIKKGNKISTKLINIKKPLMMIPSLSSHLQRETNEKGAKFSINPELRPIFSSNKKQSLLDVVCKESDIDPKSVIDNELFIYNYTSPTIWGANDEFLSSRAIDNQISVYSSLYGLLESKPKHSVAIHAVFDNEEVGSNTAQGAASTSLINTMSRIQKSLNLNSKKEQMFANSLIISSDNAHGLHPNYIEKTNKEVKCKLGFGVAIKKAASYAYSTNAVSSAIVSEIAKKSGAKIQYYYNKPGQNAGGTLARFITPQTGIMGCDLGIAQWAMHSSFETCNLDDVYQLKKLLKNIYSSSIVIEYDGKFEIE